MIIPRGLRPKAARRIREAMRPRGQHATRLDVLYCYRLLLGREPDQMGMRGYVNAISSTNMRPDELVGFFINSQEFRDRLRGRFGWKDGAPERLEVGAHTFFVRPDDPGIGAELKGGDYEPHVTAALLRRVKPGATFVDVGASVGYFSVVAGNAVGGGGRVLAFEPGPQNQSLLLLNLAANGIDNAEIFQLALSDKAETLAYNREGANGAVAPFDGSPDILGVSDLVRATTLDKAIGAQRVDLMKVDVEGAEGRVLRGGLGLLRREKPILFIEFSPQALEARSGMTGRDFLTMLTELGYEFDVLVSARQTDSARSIDYVLRAASDSPHIDLVAWHREKSV